MLPATATVFETAKTMRESNIGDVIVVEDGSQSLCGIVTDRDLVVRVIAEGRDPRTTRLKNVCSRQLLALTPTQTTDEAAKLMRGRAVRRLPVVDTSQERAVVVGIVSLGDLAESLDRKSVLGQISAMAPNH